MTTKSRLGEAPPRACNPANPWASAASTWIALGSWEKIPPAWTISLQGAATALASTLDAAGTSPLTVPLDALHALARGYAKRDPGIRDAILGILENLLWVAGRDERLIASVQGGA